MKQLYVLYDAECAMCRRCRVWLGRQPAFVPLIFVPLQSPELACRFPGIEGLNPSAQLLVVSDDGDVWRGERAWVTVLWALREFREWSQRLANPLLLPFARRACELVSENRSVLSRWFNAPDDELHGQLSAPSAQAHGLTGYSKALSSELFADTRGKK